GRKEVVDLTAWANRIAAGAENTLRHDSTVRDLTEAAMWRFVLGDTTGGLPEGRGPLRKAGSIKLGEVIDFFQASSRAAVADHPATRGVAEDVTTYLAPLLETTDGCWDVTRPARYKESRP